MLVCSSKIKQKSWDILKANKIYPSFSFYEVQSLRYTSHFRWSSADPCQLGVILDPILLLEKQASATAKKHTFCQLSVTSKSASYVDLPNLATWTHATVTSKSNYCNAFYMGLCLKSTSRDQLVQNAVAQLVSGLGATWSMHIGPTLQSLHWRPISYWIQFKVLTVTYKALDGLGPSYLKDLLSFYALPWQICSSVQGLLLLSPCKGPKSTTVHKYDLLLCPHLVEWPLWGGQEGHVSIVLQTI